jgi:outer membrane protein assembly factor BamE (lipoprotein component of BamABCDE complex)
MVLAGCTTSTGRDFNMEAVRAVRPGFTTRGQVLTMMGTPFTRTSSDGVETWDYKYSTAAPNVGGQAFVPFVGGLLPGAYKLDQQTKGVRITFQNGVVSNCRCATVASHSESGGGLLGPLALASPSESGEAFDCAGAP